MFRYVKLMIIKLLMMKLHFQVIYTCILCVLLNICEVWCCCCWIVDEFMINWCCCCHEMLLSWIHAMGIHNYGICGEIWVVLKSFTKNGWIGDLWWSYVFDPSFIWIWVSFYVYKRLDKLWGRIWVLGNQNWGFWVKMEVFPESIVAEFCHNSPWRIGGEFCLCELVMESCTVLQLMFSSF